MTTRQQLKVKALRYPDWATFQSGDIDQYKKLVAWLEGVVIRLYKIEDRAELDNFQGDGWNTAYFKYLEDLGYLEPKNGDLNEALEWLLQQAISLEYQDDPQRYNTDVQHYLVSHPLDQRSPLDFTSPEVVAVLQSLATTLHIPPHDDPQVLLNAVFNIVQRKFSKQALAESSDPNLQSLKVDLADFPLGFETGDPVLDRAATVLRMLYINDLRNLQTKINEMVSAMQSLTANPKTDSTQAKIGK